MALPAWAYANADTAAQRAAQAWLTLVDAERYAESWQQAGAMFRSALPEPGWVQAAGSVRGPLGALKQRTFKTSQAARTLPGAPDGQYVVFQFEATFAAKAVAVETVTAALEPDGTWRVVGYFVK